MTLLTCMKKVGSPKQADQKYHESNRSLYEESKHVIEFTALKHQVAILCVVGIFAVLPEIPHFPLAVVVCDVENHTLVCVEELDALEKATVLAVL